MTFLFPPDASHLTISKGFFSHPKKRSAAELLGSWSLDLLKGMAASAGVLQWPAERDISSHVSLTEFLEFCKFLRRFFLLRRGWDWFGRVFWMFLVFGEGFLFFSLGFKYLRRKVTLVGLLCTPVGVIANRSPPALVNKVLVSCWFCHFF